MTPEHIAEIKWRANAAVPLPSPVLSDVSDLLAEVERLRAYEEMLDWILDHHATVRSYPSESWIGGAVEECFWWIGDTSYTTEGHSREACVQGAMMACKAVAA